MSALNGELKPYFHHFSLVRTGMLSVVSVCLPGPNVSPNSPRYTNCTCCDSRTMSCAPFLIALSSSGNRYDNVSRESSVHSMTSISYALMKSMMPIRCLYFAEIGFGVVVKPGQHYSSPQWTRLLF